MQRRPPRRRALSRSPMTFLLRVRAVARPSGLPITRLVEPRLDRPWQARGACRSTRAARARSPARSCEAGRPTVRVPWTGQARLALVAVACLASAGPSSRLSSGDTTRARLTTDSAGRSDLVQDRQAFPRLTCRSIVCSVHVAHGQYGRYKLSRQTRRGVRLYPQQWAFRMGRSSARASSGDLAPPTRAPNATSHGQAALLHPLSRRASSSPRRAPLHSDLTKDGRRPGECAALASTPVRARRSPSLGPALSRSHKTPCSA